MQNTVAFVIIGILVLIIVGLSTNYFQPTETTTTTVPITTTSISPTTTLPQTTTTIPEPVKAEKYCEEDNDCIKVDGGCCGCSSGGNSTTINKNYENYWNNKLAGECEGIVCLTVMSTDISCFAQPRCINNACTLDYEDFSVCEQLDYYNDWCYWRFAIKNNNITLCDKISVDKLDVTPGISTCKEKLMSE